MSIMMPLASSLSPDYMMQIGMLPAAMDIGEAMGRAQLSNAKTQLSITDMQNERIQSSMNRSKQRDREDDVRARLANIGLALNDSDLDDASKARLRKVKADLYAELCGVDVSTK